MRSGYHAWIPVDYDRNNGIRIIRFMLTDDNAVLKRWSHYHNAEGITMVIKTSEERCVPALAARQPEFRVTSIQVDPRSLAKRWAGKKGGGNDFSIKEAPANETALSFRSNLRPGRNTPCVSRNRRKII